MKWRETEKKKKKRLDKEALCERLKMTTFEHENDRKSIVGGPAICPEETFSDNRA